MGVDCFACHLLERVLKLTPEGKDGMSCEQYMFAVERNLCMSLIA